MTLPLPDKHGRVDALLDKQIAFLEAQPKGQSYEAQFKIALQAYREMTELAKEMQSDLDTPLSSIEALAAGEKKIRDLGIPVYPKDYGSRFTDDELVGMTVRGSPSAAALLRERLTALSAIGTPAMLDWLAERANKHREHRIYDAANECDAIISALRRADDGGAS